MSKAPAPVKHKRSLAWSWVATRDVPQSINQLNFHGTIVSVSNWEAWYPPELKQRLPFRPMLHDKSRLAKKEWTDIEIAGKNLIVHFFNEPERAGITPEDAANIWNQHLYPMKKRGNKLVSPSTASDTAGAAWIRKWMDLVKNSPPDLLGVHYYGERSADMIAFLERMHKDHPKQQIIVSEFACITRGNPKAVVKFTADVVNWMDKTPWIFEYALFGCEPKLADNFVSPDARLMNTDGKFTPLMINYMNNQPMQY